MDNATLAHSIWQVLATVAQAAGRTSFLADGPEEGALFEAVEDLVGFATRNPDVMPAWLHERYGKFLSAKGFSRGDSTVRGSYTSSALVDWSEVTPEHRVEYAIFMAVLALVTRGPTKKTQKKPAPTQRRPRKKILVSNGSGSEEGMLTDEDAVI